MFIRAHHWSVSAGSVQTTRSHIISLRSYDTLPSTSKSSMLSLSLRLSERKSVCICHLCHACYMSRQCHPPWCDNLENFLMKITNYGAPDQTASCNEREMGGETDEETNKGKQETRKQRNKRTQKSCERAYNL